ACGFCVAVLRRAGPLCLGVRWAPTRGGRLRLRLFARAEHEDQDVPLDRAACGAIPLLSPEAARCAVVAGLRGGHLLRRNRVCDLDSTSRPECEVAGTRDRRG